MQQYVRYFHMMISYDLVNKKKHNMHAFQQVEALTYWAQ